MSDKIVLLADGTRWQEGQEVFWPSVFGEQITIYSEIPRDVRWSSDGEVIFLLKPVFIPFVHPSDEMGYSTHEGAWQAGQKRVEVYIVANITRLESELAEFRRKYQEFKGDVR